MTTRTRVPTTAVLILESARPHEHEGVLSVADEMSLVSSVTHGDGWSAVRVGDGLKPIEVDRFESLPGVRRVVEVSAPYQLASKEIFETDREIRLLPAGGHLGPSLETPVGARSPLLIVAIPRWDEVDPSFSQPSAEELAGAGVSLLHAGEFSEWPLSIHRRRADLAHTAGMLLCIGVSEAGDLRAAATVADVLYVASKHMQDFNLLRKMGAVERPVLLARNFGATVEEFLLAAEYVLAHGNGRVIFCESGSKTPSSPGRPRFEINAIPLLKWATHLPVIADPSDTVRDVRLIGAVANAAVAAGCDGLVLRVGEKGASGASQSTLTPPQCRRLVESANVVARSVGRETVQTDSKRARTASMQNSHPRVTSAVDTFVDPHDVLRVTNSTLGSVIESTLRSRPRLDVVRQTRVESPHPSWLNWALRPEGDLLVRWTGYRIGRTVLSRNVAYVDVSRVDPKIVVRLQSGQMNLGQLFSSSEIDKFGFEFGTSVDAGVLGEALNKGHEDMANLGPYVWRRYIAATSGRAGFVVVEALPTFAWRRHLANNGRQLDTQGGVA
jgi:3-deoxy-7-phosphoheptulonate synthase